MGLIALGLLLLAANLVRSLHCGQDTGCVDIYWARQYLVSYSDGYQSRALAGEVLRLFFHDRIGYLAINGIGFALAALVPGVALALLARRFIHDIRGMLLAIVLLTGPLVTVYFEVLGDPLQISFLLVIACMLWLPRLGSPAAILLGLVVSVMAVLVHEASVFLLLPALLLVNRSRGGGMLNPWWVLVTCGVLAVAVAMTLSRLGPSGSGLGLVTRSHAVLFNEHGPPDALLQRLLWELGLYVGSVGKTLHLFTKLAGVLLWPALALVLLSAWRKSEGIIRTYLFLLLTSLPLYLTAHDWGRFTIYSLTLALVIEALAPEGHQLIRSRLIDAVASWLSRTGRPYASELLFWCLMPLAYTSHGNYREDGLLKFNWLAVLVCLLIFRFASARRDASSTP